MKKAAFLVACAALAGCESMPEPPRRSSSRSMSHEDAMELRVREVEDRIESATWREHTRRTQEMISPGYRPRPWEY